MPVFVFGPFRLDPAERRLLREGAPVALTPKVFDTLEVLVERRGRLVEKDDLMRRLWPDMVVEEVTLARNISSLRRVLGDTPEDERYIETVSKRGYRFVATVEEARVDGHPPTGVAPDGRGPAVEPARRSRPSPAVVLAALGLLTLGALAATLVRRTPPARVMAARFPLALPDGVVPARFPTGNSMALSADGTHLVFSAYTQGKTRLWLRPLDRLESTPLEGTEGAASPFWSPDGRAIGFFAGGKLKRVAVSGGPPDTLCDAAFGNAGTWSTDGTILFAEWTGEGRGLHRVPAEGGAVTRLELRTSDGPALAKWPAFLADGRRFVYLRRTFGPRPIHTIAVGSLDAPSSRDLAPADSQPIATRRGLLFVREGTLLHQDLDSGATRLRGEATPVADLVWYMRPSGSAEFTASADGSVVAYREPPPRIRLAWLDRGGTEVGTVGEPDFLDGPRLSPDGTRVVFEIADPRTGVRDIWIHDLVRGARSRVTLDPLDAAYPVWSPDAGRLLYGSASAIAGSPIKMQIVRSDASGGRESVVSTSRMQVPLDWSRDGRWILFGDNSASRDPQREVWLLPLEGERRPRPLESSPVNRYDARFSPDSRWVAFVSEETGRPEVFVVPVEGRGPRHQISTSGGVSPRWRADGREIFYVSPDRTLMAVPRDPASPFPASPPRPLFRWSGRSAWGIGGGPFSVKYDVDARGDRFLCLVGPETSPPIVVAIGWERRRE